MALTHLLSFLAPLAVASSTTSADPTQSATTAPAAPPPSVTTPAPPAAPASAEPLAGFTGDTAFIRSADNMFIMNPNGRLQVDSYLFQRPTPAMPFDTILLRRARLEVTGWVGQFFYGIGGDFALGPPAPADPVAQSWIAATDDFVGYSAFDGLLTAQIGQFDAPFTFENRTSDKYIDFMERSITVRTFAIPSNKEVGLMLHGLPADKLFYYSLGIFNGDGQNFRDVDGRFDFIGRAWIAPLGLMSFDEAKRIHIGGSVWVGNRSELALPFSTQSTQGGFKFFESKWTQGASSLELHQDGKLEAAAVELDAPLTEKLGLRAEWVHKAQELGEDDIGAAASGKLTRLGHAKVDGWSGYIEAWYWIVGDDRMLPDGGLEWMNRMKSFKTTPPEHGLAVLARVERLQEQLTSDTPTLGDPSLGSTRVSSYELGVNYWYSKRLRLTFNYVLNHLEGDSATIASAIKKNGGSPDEMEFLFRAAIAL